MQRNASLKRFLLHVFLVGASAAFNGRETPAVEPLPTTDRRAARTDLHGDPLPEGAVARLGTLRLRHGDMVRSLGFFPDGKTLLSADWHTVHVWDAANGRLLRSFGDPHGRQFQSSAFTVDGSLAALTMDTGEISIWDVRTGQRQRVFQAGRFPSVIFSPDGKTLTVLDHDKGDRQALRLWDATSGTELHELVGHKDTIHQVLFSKDGKTLITAGDDKTIRFWDATTGKESRNLDCPAPVLQMAISPDGRTLALTYGKRTEYKLAQGSAVVWSAESEVHLWDAFAGKETRLLKGLAENGAACLVFAPNSETLWTSDFQGVRSWNVRTGEQIGKLPQEFAYVSTMAFTSDGETLATGGADQVIRLWDVKQGREESVASGHRGPVGAVAVASDGQTIATAGGDSTIRLWDRATSKARCLLSKKAGVVIALAYTPDGQGLLATGTPLVDETVRLWDIATSRELQGFAGISSLSAPDGKTLITVAKDGIVHHWELATGKEIRQWPTSIKDFRLMHVTSDGRTLVSWSADQKVRFWDLAAGKELRRFDGPRFEEDSTNRIYAVAISPNGRFAAFGGQVNYLVIYDMTEGKEVRRLKLPGPTASLTFSPDSRFLASGDWDNGTVRIWELASGQQFQNWPGHQGRIIALCFAADSSILVSGSVDTTALVWDLTGGIHGKALSAADLDACWADLAGAGAVRGQQAVRKLAAAPDQAVAYLDNRLQPVRIMDEGRAARWIADLDSEEFNVRETASAELEKWGESAAGALRQALAKQPSAEVQHRIEVILKKQVEAWSGDLPEQLRLLRALETLELCGTPEAKQVLQRLAQGAGDARLTEEARAALGRMKR